MTIKIDIFIFPQLHWLVHYANRQSYPVTIIQFQIHIPLMVVDLLKYWNIEDWSLENYICTAPELLAINLFPNKLCFVLQLYNNGIWSGTLPSVISLSTVKTAGHSSSECLPGNWAVCVCLSACVNSGSLHSERSPSLSPRWWVFVCTLACIIYWVFHILYTHTHTQNNPNLHIWRSDFVVQIRKTAIKWVHITTPYMKC